MALAVAIVEPIQVGAVPLAALALVAAVLMSALPHLPLEGASRRLVALQYLSCALMALMVALLGPPPPLQFGLDRPVFCMASVYRNAVHRTNLG